MTFQQLVFGLIILGSLACAPPKDAEENQSEILVTLDNRILYANELNNIIHPSANQKDSTALANAYIDQWIHDQLLMKEATKYFSSDFEIEKLVDDYREKLIKFNFENKIINERFDTIVTTKELERFYDLNKERFVLNRAIIRCLFGKISRKQKDLDKFNKLWRQDDIAEIKTYLDKYAEDKKVDEGQWYTWDEVQEWKEDWNLNRTKSGMNQRYKDAEYEYFLKVIEYRDEKEISPLPFVSKQLIQMILHQRKQDIIENYKSELYNKALEKNQIKIIES